MAVMLLVQVVCNVLIHQVNAPVKQVSRAQHATLLVVVILLAPVEQLVTPPQASALATADIPVPHAIL